jgi:colanic acid biosynthesis protein WcaH
VLESGVARPLPADEFRFVIERTPLVSLDLLVRDPAGRLLVGLRRNEPARGCYFVPGGRIGKGSTHQEALREIAEVEIGLTGLEWDDRNVEGVFTHLYDANALGAAGVTTHYVVIAYRVDVESFEPAARDDQHLRFEWIDAEAASGLDAPVHEYTLAYLRLRAEHDLERGAAPGA